jgi:hypothetical protein
MQLHASSALDCPRYAVQPLRCIFTLKVGEVRADLDTPMPVVEHGPRRAVGVVAQDRHLVEEDLSPRVEIVVVQEETQERAVAGGALRIPKDNRVLRSSGLGIRTGSRNAKKTDSNRRRLAVGVLLIIWWPSDSCLSASNLVRMQPSPVPSNTLQNRRIKSEIYN